MCVHLGEGLELLLDEEAGNAWHLALAADERGVGAVGSAEGVRDKDVAELGERLPELLDLGGLGLEGLALVDALLAAALSVVDALALLLDVEADVLENDDGALGGVGAGSLDLGADAVGEEGDGLAHELTELQEDRISSSARTAVRRTRAHTTLLQYTVPGQGLDRTSIHFLRYEWWVQKCSCTLIPAQAWQILPPSSP